MANFCARVSSIILAALASTLSFASSSDASELKVASLDVISRSSGSYGASGHNDALVRTLIRVNLSRADGQRAATAYLTSFTSPAPGTNRPVVFAFNGGPGASSIFLQLGLLGPQLVKLPSDPAATFGPPYSLVDNPDGLFDRTDVVFVDPVGTGYGRLLSPSEAGSVWSAGGDASYIAATIRAWLARQHRDGSPVYLLGESYGAKRSVEVAYDLACVAARRDCRSVSLAGIVLLSQSVTEIDTSQRPGNVQGSAVGIPTLAALAWYHGKIARPAPSLEEWVAQAEEFASTEYIAAVFQGSDLEPSQRRRIEKRLSALTGLSPDFYRENGLMLTKDRFRYLLLAPEGKVMALADGRFTTAKAETGRQNDRFDDLVGPTFAWGALQSYDVIGGDSYILSDNRIEQKWIYGAHLTPSSDYPYPQHLNALLGMNPQLRLFIAGGYFDTMASFGGDAFLRRHLSAARPGQVLTAHYPGGHMFYSDAQSRHAFAEALRAFIR